MTASNPTTPERLLAKTPREDRIVSLAEHCTDTAEAAGLIFRPEGRRSRNWARFFRFDETDRRRFLLNLQVAGLFHDIGKANDDFQAAVLTRGKEIQTLRHEHISALVLALPVVRFWLESNPELDVDAITAAVLSHHLKAAADGGEFVWAQPRTPDDAGQARVRLHLGHRDVLTILARVQELAQLPAPPALPRNPWAEQEDVWEEALRFGRRAAEDYRDTLAAASPARRRLLWALKAGLVVADSVASGIVRVGGVLADWIEDVVHRPALTKDELARDIIKPRVADIERRTGKPFIFQDLQLMAATQGERALLLAGCGSGKTLAAWNWAESILARRELGHVIILYPTRGTASEGFRDYVGWAPQADAALVHGTSRFELEAMSENPSEHLRGKNFLDEKAARLFALGLWPKRYFSATVDQFLGFLEHSYTALCLLPVLADSALILDEVHSYDRRMFGNLKAFLANFEPTILCMTATLPRGRRRELAALGLRAFPSAKHREHLKDLARQEERPRYGVRQVATPDVAFDRTLSMYRAGKKTLWVVNTVDRCQEIASMIRREVPGVLVYHSRFRLMDRHSAHEGVVQMFKEAPPVIAVTTQVCEMSLDLDADLLVTELSPVTSLVQRFGRSCRSPSRKPSERAEILWYLPPNPSPYTFRDFDGARSFLAALGAGHVSQRDLAEGLERIEINEPRLDDSAGFLTGGYYATPGPFRESDDHAQSCVLDCDVDAVLQQIRHNRQYDGLVLPAPRSTLLTDEQAPRPKKFPRFLGIVDARRYDPLLGLRRGQEIVP